MTSITRSVEDPAGFSGVMFNHIDPDWLYLHPNAEKYTSAEIPYLGTRRLFEAYTPNSTPDHKTWKSFEHYRAETNYAHGTAYGGIALTGDLQRGNHFLSQAACWDDRVFNTYTSVMPPSAPINGVEAWYVPRLDGGFIPEPNDLAQLHQNAVKAMMPKVKNELSSLVSLYEIKDALTLRGTIKNVGKAAKTVLSKLMKGHTSKPLSKVLAHATADTYLSGMFNVKPLLQDICGIYRAVAKYERRVNELINRSGTLQTTHFKCDLKEELGDVTSDWSEAKPIGAHPLGMYFAEGRYKTIQGYLRFRNRTLTYSSVFRCELQYNYSFTAFQREHASILGLLDALGVNLNPAYIWNVIPWSFVVDWVMDVSSWLSRYEVKNLEPTVNILQYCWSVRRERVTTTDGEIHSNKFYDEPGEYIPQYFNAPEVKEVAYRRSVDMPDISSFTTSGLSLTELSLGAALITTRRRRNTRDVGFAKLNAKLKSLMAI